MNLNNRKITNHLPSPAWSKTVWPTRNTTYAASTELSQQNELKTRLIQQSLSRQRNRLHCNTPLIIIWQISVCAIYDTICIEGLYMKCYKILKIEKNASIWHINITFSGPSIPTQGVNSPLVKNHWLRGSGLGVRFNTWHMFSLEVQV